MVPDLGHCRYCPLVSIGNETCVYTGTCGLLVGMYLSMLEIITFCGNVVHMEVLIYSHVSYLSGLDILY